MYSTFVKKYLRILALGHPDCCDWEPPNSKLFHTTKIARLSLDYDVV